ncbi:MAG TPA: MarR family transcriptional regulator [Blastocatellia bacterium]|nr:MarR family transcriptional regulator [Blastocatellia bacterium]
MGKATVGEAEAVLDRFAEAMFRLMIEHHQKQAIELDLTVPQAQALRVLRRGPLCAAELAIKLSISAPAVTQLTNRLTRKHLIERRPVDGDRRSVLVALTDKGEQAVDRFRERRNIIFCGALAHMDDEDRISIVVALSKMVAALEEFSDQESVDNMASGLQKKIVHEGEGTQSELHNHASRTAVQPIAASNVNSRMKADQTGRRMKMEWD